jgi:hypothetical protein
MCRGLRGPEAKDTMSQKNVEMIFGKLATDEEFRRCFRRDPASTVLELAEHGLELTRAELSALVRTDVTIFDHVAEVIDPRLQKASLKSGAFTPDGRPRRSES